MTNKIKFLLSLLVIGTGTTGIAMGATSLKTPLAMAQQGNAERCGAIHFGPELNNINYDLGTASGKGTYTDGSSITKIGDEITTTGAVYADPSGHVRMGSSKASGALNISLPDTKSYVNIWAAGYGSDIGKMTVASVNSSYFETFTMLGNQTSSSTAGTFNCYTALIDDNSFTITVQKKQRCWIASITYLN